MGKRGRKERREFHNVTIIDTANEGLAIGRCEDGRIIQVKHAVPGDVADVVAIEKRKGMFITRPTFFTAFSEYRADPFCAHFGICGGCKWQHMTYEAQLQFKEKSVHDSFRRLGGLETSGIRPIVGAVEERYYRNKLEFTASDSRWLTETELANKDLITDKDGIGFHLPGSFDKVLDVKHCYLQPDPSNAIRLYIKSFCEERQWSFLNLRNKTGFLRNIIVRINLQGDVMVVLVVGNDNREWIDALCHALREKFDAIKSLHACINTKVNDAIHDLPVRLEYGDPTIIETLDHVRFHIGPKSFFQTNSKQAANLYRMTKELAALQPSDHVFDLYCGVGSLGIYMADQCSHVVGIEQISEAIDDARDNARLNGITNIDFEVGKVEMLLDPAFIARHGKPDVIITDPPRAGMHPEVIPHLMAAAPDRIVYVSCNPATQARDISLLREQYELTTAIPVDMFPHTHHVECIALLQRK
jgi:23S rRNA (uracil1939-C5)-methyltransferase